MIALCLLPMILVAMSADASAASVESIIAEYERYRRMTPEPVALNPAFAEACVAHAPDPALGPHDDTWMTVFMNAAAATRFEAGSPAMYPEGAVVLKRKQDFAGRPEALGGMVKRAPGYDPPNNDWEFFYAKVGDTPVAGRLEDCGNCHARVRESDFVFGDWAKPGPEPSRLTE